jgi:hypothetical protein
MVSLRRVIFGLLAASVAFAAGVALGNGPLQGRSDRATLSADNIRLGQRLRELRAAGTYDDAFVTATSTGLVKGRLGNRVVTLVVLPGVPASTVSGVRADLAAAGARVATTLTVLPALIDSAKKVYVASVADNTMRGAPDLRSRASGDPYDAMGALVGRAYATTAKSGSVFDKESVDIDAQLTGANLVRRTGSPVRRGSLVLVLDAGRHGRSAALRASRAIEGSLLSAVADRCSRLVVASTPGGDGRGGLLSAIRSQSALGSVATVNIIGTRAGRTAAILVLAATTGRTGGRYGVVSGKAVLPAALH